MHNKLKTLLIEIGEVINEANKQYKCHVFHHPPGSMHGPFLSIRYMTPSLHAWILMRHWLSNVTVNIKCGYVVVKLHCEHKVWICGCQMSL